MNSRIRSRLKAAVNAAATAVFFAGHVVSASAELPLDIADAGAKPVPVKTGLGRCDCPVVDGERTLSFLERPTGRIWRVTKEGVVSEESVHVPDALCVVPQKGGAFLVGKPKQLSRYDSVGAEKLLIKGDLLGEPFDFSPDSNGAMFFASVGVTSVFFRSPDGAKVAQRNVDFEASGVAYVDERERLYVSNAKENKLVVYRISVDGLLSLSPTVIPNIPDPRGLTVDDRGNIFVVSGKERAVLVLDENGRELGRFQLPGEQGASGPQPTNVVFGGVEHRTLFITADGGLWKLELKTPGPSH